MLQHDASRTIIDIDNCSGVRRSDFIGTTIYRVRSTAIGIDIDHAPATIIVQAHGQPAESYRRTIAIRRASGRIETVSYAPVQPGTILVVENKKR